MRPPGLHELKRTLDKELIEVDVRPALDLIDAGLTNELRHLLRLETSAGPGLVDAAVTANHVPWRVADNRVEARWPVGMHWRTRPGM